MKNKIGQIIETLEQTQHLYEDLLAMVQKERSAVLNSDVDQLNAVLVDKETLLAQLGQLETLRMRQLEQIAGQLQLPVAQLTLSALATHASAQHARQIHSKRNALRQLTSTLSKANEENRSMLSHCLNLVQGSLQFLHHWITPPSVYGASGHINGGAKSGHLLSGTV